MLINKSDENDVIMTFPQSYYLFKHIYFVSLSGYFSIISAKIDIIVSKTHKIDIIVSKTHKIDIIVSKTQTNKVSQRWTRQYYLWNTCNSERFSISR